MAKKTSVQFYYDYIEQLKDLDDKQFRSVLEAMVVYDETKELVDLEPMAKVAFNFIKKRIDYDKDQYDLICERNKENGKKGGRPKNPEKPKITQKNPDKPKKPELELELDIDKELDNNINTTTDIYNYISSNYDRVLSPNEIYKIQLWLSEFNEEMIKKAIEISCLQNKKTFSYTEGILKNWKGKGYKTIGDLQNEEKVYNNEPKKTKSGGFQL